MSKPDELLPCPQWLKDAREALKSNPPTEEKMLMQWKAAAELLATPPTPSQEPNLDGIAEKLNITLAAIHYDKCDNGGSGSACIDQLFLAAIKSAILEATEQLRGELLLWKEGCERNADNLREALRLLDNRRLENLAAQKDKENGFLRMHKQIELLLAHCGDSECETCAKIICPFEDDMHYHHDGCPSCCNCPPEKQNIDYKIDDMIGGSLPTDMNKQQGTKD